MRLVKQSITLAHILQEKRLSKVRWHLLYPEANGTQPAARIIYRRVIHSKDGSRELRNLLNGFGSAGSRGGEKGARGAHFSGGGFRHVYDPSGRKQYCMVKMRYSYKAASHKKFIDTYMPQKNKEQVIEKPVLFGCDGYEQRMTNLHFKFIISPESDKAPLKEAVKAFIEKTNFETGYRLDWKAVIHTDTAHPHAHILVNGNDLKGKPVKFKKDFIRRRSHQITQDIITAMIGERTQEQITLSKSKSITAARWTSHDEKISMLVKPIQDDRFGCAIYPVSEELSRRLSFLAELGLAEYHNGLYKLEKRWDKSLTAAGRYNSFLTVREDLKWSSAHNLHLYTDTTGAISGTVRKVSVMDDEGVWNNSIVVENKELKKAWYVPLYNPPRKKLEGKEVTVEMTHNSKGLLVPVITAVDTAGERSPYRRGEHRSSRDSGSGSRSKD